MTKYDREFTKAISLSGEDMSDEQYFMIQDAMEAIFNLETDLTAEEDRERMTEEYYSPQVQPHSDDVWNMRYRAMGKRLWPVFSRRY